MNLLQMMTTLAWIFAFFFLSLVLFQLTNQLLTPRSLLARGPLYHPKGWLHFVSWFLLESRLTSIGLRDSAIVVFIMSLIALQMATVPLYFPSPMFYGLSSAVFLLIYFLCRLVWALFFHRSTGEGIQEGQGDHVLTASVALLIVFGALSFVKGGEQLFIFSENSTILLKKPSCIFLFVLLFVYSEHFFIPAEKGTVYGIGRWPYFLSRVVWFFILPWIFIGPVSSSFSLNYLFYLVLGVALNTVHSLVSSSFPGLGTALRLSLDERYFLPALTAGSLLIYVEAFFF